MSRESVQFIEMVREAYCGLLEIAVILLNIAEAELNGEISKEQADELRTYYKSLGGQDD